MGLEPTLEAAAVASDDSFREGYIAGWRSVRGVAENPDVPASPVLTGMSMYLIGFSRGICDGERSPGRACSHLETPEAVLGRCKATGA
jgi:hypothetical protein